MKLKNLWSFVPPTIPEKQPGHPLGQDKPPIRDIVLNMSRFCYLNKAFCIFWNILLGTINLLGPGQHNPIRKILRQTRCIQKKHNYLFPMVVEMPIAGVEIVGQGSLLIIELCWTKCQQFPPLDEHVFLAKHTRWSNSPPSYQQPQSEEDLQLAKNQGQKHLNWSYRPVKPRGFQIKENHSGASTLPALMVILATPSTGHISGRQAVDRILGNLY